MPRLKILNARVALDLHFENAITIGRHIANSLPLPDTEISRRHAQIFPREDEFVITDLGSRNGVYVNGEKFQETRLKTGDEIAIGTTLVFFNPSDDTALSDLLSPRGSAIWKKIPSHDHFVPAQMTTYSPVELNEIVEDWLERRAPHPPISYNLHSKFLAYALSTNQPMTRRDLCRSTLEFLHSRIGGERFAVMGLNAEKKELEVHALLGCNEGDLTVAKDILRIVVDAEKGVYCTNTASDFRFLRLAKSASSHVGSFVGVPIFCGTDYYGFIYLDQPPNGPQYDFKSLFQAHLAATILGAGLNWFRMGRKRKSSSD